MPSLLQTRRAWMEWWRGKTSKKFSRLTNYQSHVIARNFVNSFRIETHKIIHGNGWFSSSSLSRLLSLSLSLVLCFYAGMESSVCLELSHLHVHCSPIISIIHDDLLISFNAQHKKNHRPMKVKIHVSLTFALDVMMILFFFLCKVLMIFQKYSHSLITVVRKAKCVCMLFIWS